MSPQLLLLPPSPAAAARVLGARVAVAKCGHIMTWIRHTKRQARRLVFTVRKTCWFWFYIGAWSNPSTHWRKWAEVERWLREQRCGCIGNGGGNAVMAQCNHDFFDICEADPREGLDDDARKGRLVMCAWCGEQRQLWADGELTIRQGVRLKIRGIPRDD